jgi:hypothetical protein
MKNLKGLRRRFHEKEVFNISQLGKENIDASKQIS